VSARKPFTLKQRRRIAQDFDYRPVNNWGSGDLPAPWCQGDVVRLPEIKHNERMEWLTGEFFVVAYVCSIDEGDAWYCRLGDGDWVSDRLHIAYADRASETWEKDIDWMAGVELVETRDPEGLALREQMLADGWSYTPPAVCPTCGHRQ
jgi:hypothetical protein